MNNKQRDSILNRADKLIRLTEKNESDFVEVLSENCDLICENEELRGIIKEFQEKIKTLESKPPPKKAKVKSYYCSSDGHRYVVDPKGKYYSIWDARVNPKEFRLIATPLPRSWRRSGIRYTRLPEPKRYKALDGKLYIVDPKGKYQWNSPMPGGKDNGGETFNPYLRFERGRPGDQDFSGIVRFYTLVKKGR